MSFHSINSRSLLLATAHEKNSRLVTQAELKVAFDQNVFKSLPTAALGLAILYVIFFISHLIVLPPTVATQMAILAGFSALIMIALHYVLKKPLVKSSLANPIAALMTAIVLINGLAHLYFTRDPQQSTNILLLIIGVGFLFLSIRWFALALLVTLISWAVLAGMTFPLDALKHFSFAIASASFLSILVQVVRLKTFRRLEMLRLSDERRTAALEDALAAAEKARYEAEVATSDLQRSIVILQESEERFRRFTNFEGICVHDSGIILDANQSLARMFGYELEELIGKSIIEMVASESRSEVFTRYSQGDEKPYSAVGLRKDGSTFPIEIYGQSVAYQGRAVRVAEIRDITERRQAEEERSELLRREQAARQNAETANRFKDEFLATVSHELRTPLNAMLGWATILRKRQLNTTDIQRGIETIERNARLQAQIINDLLDVSRIIAGKLRLEMCPIDVVKVINDAIETARPSAEAKQIELHSEIATDLVQINGDADRLQQVLWNLLSNAVKFTPPSGKIWLGAICKESQIEITLRDTGQGIGKDFLPYVFERFRQEDSSTTRKHSGLGLGLAIVQYIVEQHGGTVRAESAGADQGSTFTVLLPAIPSELTESSDKPSNTVFESNNEIDVLRMDGMRVLIVDDEQDASDALSLVLQGYGAEVSTAASAAEALEKLKVQMPAVIIADIGMPIEDGYDFIVKVRAQEYNIPAIALTAFARDEDRNYALKVGYQEHIAKPVEPVEIASLVCRILAKKLS